MSDVAALGLAVDSAPVTAATAALQKFTAAAAPAAAAADRVVLANGKLGPTLQTVESMARRAGVSVDEMTKRIQASSSSYGAANTSMGVFAKQTQAVVVANQNAVKAANDNTQAITGLSKAASENNNQFERLAATITRRFIAALVIKEVKDFIQYLWGLNAVLAATATTAELASVSYQKLQGLQTAAGYKGINSDALNTAMIEFAKQTDLAKNGLGNLRTLLVANGLTVGDTAANFAKVADLVANAASGAQKLSILQQAGLPANKEFADLMSQGGAAITRAADASKKLSDAQLEEAKKLNDAWNKLWTDIENGAKRVALGIFSAFAGNPFSLPNGDNGKPPTRVNISGGTTVGGPGAKTVDPELLKQQIALEQQRIGILGQTATVQQQVRAVELAIQAARLNNVNITKDEAANLRRVTEEQALGTFQIKAATDAENVKIAALFKSTEAATAYAIVQTKINEAIALGRPLTEDQIANLQKEAEEFAKTEKKASEYKQIIDALRSGVAQFGVDLIRNLKAGEGAMAALGHAAQSLSQTLTSGAINSLLKGDWVAAGVQGIAAIVTGIIGGNQADKDAQAAAQAKAVADAASKLERIAQLTTRALTAALDTSSRAGALALQELQFAAELSALPVTSSSTGGRGRRGAGTVTEDPERVALLNAQNAERLALQKQWDDKELAQLEAYNEARAARELSYQDRLFAATNDVSTLSGALAEFDRKANQERIEEMKAGGEEINDLIAAQEAERSNIYKKFADDTADYIMGVAKSINAFLQGLKTGSNSILSPQDQLASARSFFTSQLGLAKGGDKDALSNITQSAQALLDASKAFNASGSGYVLDYNLVTSALQGLGYAQGGMIPGYAGGGMVGNGMFGVDSVLARFAGGGNIALAGGEFVMPAAQTRAHLPQLEAMRSGASNDNAIQSLGQQLVRAMAGVSIAEMNATREDNADLRSLILRLIRAVEGNKPPTPRPGSDTRPKAA